jgi:hypothetical protein
MIRKLNLFIEFLIPEKKPLLVGIKNQSALLPQDQAGKLSRPE